MKMLWVIGHIHHLGCDDGFKRDIPVHIPNSKNYTLQHIYCMSITSQ